MPKAEVSVPEWRLSLATPRMESRSESFNSRRRWRCFMRKGVSFRFLLVAGLVTNCWARTRPFEETVTGFFLEAGAVAFVATTLAAGFGACLAGALATTFLAAGLAAGFGACFLAGAFETIFLVATLAAGLGACFLAGAFGAFLGTALAAVFFTGFFAAMGMGVGVLLGGGENGGGLVIADHCVPQEKSPFFYP